MNTSQEMIDQTQRIAKAAIDGAREVIQARMSES